MKRLRLSACLSVSLVVIVLAFAFGDDLFMSKSERTDFMMDTVITVRIRGRDSDKTAEQAMAAVKALETDCLSRTIKGSDIFRLNSARSLNTANKKTLSVINEALGVCKKSGGAFDITLGAVSDLWDFKSGKAVLPQDELVAQAIKETGYDSIAVNGDSVRVSGSAEVDLGSVGKGAACDSVREVLMQTDTKEAVVSVGGSILLYGSRDFEVGIRDPFGTASDYAAVLSTKSTCVSTSGIYERGFDLNGKHYHHILSAETGYPVQNGLVSVTAVSESGVVSDALSTACFALGVKKGMALADEYSAGAVFITADKTVYATDNIKASLTLSGGYTFAE